MRTNSRAQALKLGFVAGHCCIRVQKMAIPLMEHCGHTVYLCSQKLPSMAHSYDMFCQAFSIHQLRNWIRIVDHAVDLYHVHNEPSWFVTAIKEVSDKPVILDVHDSFLARVTPEEHDKHIADGKNVIRITPEERNNFQLADGLVFPARPFADLIISEYGLKQPHCILPSYLPHNLHGYQQNKDWYGGLVYEGRVDLPEKIQEEFEHSAGFTYTDYSDLARQCKDIGIDFHIYARGDEAFLKVYKDIAVPHKPEAFNVLIEKLSRHDWGLVGNSFHTPEWEVALPNKLWEYVAAGTPVVSINAKHSSEVIEEHGIGITVNSIQELADRWAEHTEIRKHLLKVRGKFTMENNIHVLEDLYREVLQ